VVLAHADALGGKEMHINYAVDKKFVVTQTSVTDAPDQAKMKTFIAQLKGKKLSDAWKVGKDLKTTSGLAPAVAQTVA
jgi:ribosomal protein L12E/L44/L45/RPP1/RPP2